MASIEKSDFFLSVVEDHKGIIYKIANSYCKDAEDREDLAQEMIFQLWKSFHRYNNEFKYSTWIYRIALNVAISFYRKESRRQKIHSPIGEHVMNISTENHNDETEKNILALQQFISELKDLDKALMLLYLEEKSHREIADILGITETNVATKIGRIKTTLKEKFNRVQNH